jgi:hypothetical protein
VQECATITAVRVLDGYRVELTFSDAVCSNVDLANRIVGRGGVFAPLEDREYFRHVAVNSGLGTIVWPNGADFCPDLLHAWATGEPVTRPEPTTVAL